ncbi:UNVERIFIED_CONTAM: hypothetical protein HDU68_000070, partial [Siphonaria sp. JEL0065]
NAWPPPLPIPTQTQKSNLSAELWMDKSTDGSSSGTSCSSAGTFFPLELDPQNHIDYIGNGKFNLSSSQPPQIITVNLVNLIASDRQGIASCYRIIQSIGTEWEQYEQHSASAWGHAGGTIYKLPPRVWLLYTNKTRHGIEFVNELHELAIKSMFWLKITYHFSHEVGPLSIAELASPCIYADGRNGGSCEHIEFGRIDEEVLKRSLAVSRNDEDGCRRLASSILKRGTSNGFMAASVPVSLYATRDHDLHWKMMELDSSGDESDDCSLIGGIPFREKSRQATKKKLVHEFYSSSLPTTNREGHDNCVFLSGDNTKGISNSTLIPLLGCVGFKKCKIFMM